MTSKNRNYCKSAPAVQKNYYNNTQVADDIHGNSEIANVFKTKCIININNSQKSTSTHRE